MNYTFIIICLYSTTVTPAAGFCGFILKSRSQSCEVEGGSLSGDRQCQGTIEARASFEEEAAHIVN